MVIHRNMLILVSGRVIIMVVFIIFVLGEVIKSVTHCHSEYLCFCVNELRTYELRAWFTTEKVSDAVTRTCIIFNVLS